MVRSGRPSYGPAVRWIAVNDSPDDGPMTETIQGYVTTKLVADLFGVSDLRVAIDVALARERAIIKRGDPDELARWGYTADGGVAPRPGH